VALDGITLDGLADLLKLLPSLLVQIIRPDKMEWDELGLPATVENFAYYRLSLVDHTLDSNSRLCPLDNGRHTSPPKVDLGPLDKLPQELLEMVLGQLDIQSLTKFRRVNRRGMQAVDSIHAYKQIVTRFPTAL
jgi:hypothetical protein